jgi:hypothetical protein
MAEPVDEVNDDRHQDERQSPQDEWLEEGHGNRKTQPASRSTTVASGGMADLLVPGATSSFRPNKRQLGRT